MGRILATLIVIGGLALGFSHLTADPFGATTRTTIETQASVEIAHNEAQASVEIAEQQAQASIQVAEWQAKAQMESAQAAADAEKKAAEEQRKTNEAWATMMPLLFLIIAAAGALWIVLFYRGRAFLTLAQQGITPQLFTGQGQQVLPKADKQPLCGLTPEEQLARYAAFHNQRLLKHNDRFLLVDKQSNQVVKQLVRKG